MKRTTLKIPSLNIRTIKYSSKINNVKYSFSWTNSNRKTYKTWNNSNEKHCSKIWQRTRIDGPSVSFRNRRDPEINHEARYFPHLRWQMHDQSLVAASRRSKSRATPRNEKKEPGREWANRITIGSRDRRSEDIRKRRVQIFRIFSSCFKVKIFHIFGTFFIAKILHIWSCKRCGFSWLVRLIQSNSVACFLFIRTIRNRSWEMNKGENFGQAKVLVSIGRKILIFENFRQAKVLVSIGRKMLIFCRGILSLWISVSRLASGTSCTVCNYEEYLRAMFSMRDKSVFFL